MLTAFALVFQIVTNIFQGMCLDDKLSANVTKAAVCFPCSGKDSLFMTIRSRFPINPDTPSQKVV
jgi:hypothetical protein